VPDRARSRGGGVRGRCRFVPEALAHLRPRAAHRRRVTGAVEHRFLATESTGEVSALLVRPRGARSLYVFAHGAGAPMRHAFMESVAERLADRAVASFRYNFPYMEARKRG